MEPSTENIFHIIEHIVPCQHIREYPGATVNGQADGLQLAVKQYIPLDNPNPEPGDVTILAAHGNGFPKELYEPLWEDLHKSSKSEGFRIRGIWMADASNQGQSGVINEELLGNDPSWFDHSRDLLHLINVKRSDMPQPLVGIGHSMGGLHMANLSLIHPRLLHSLVLVEPVIQPETNEISTALANLSLYRRDRWPSREAAAKKFRDSPFYRKWDERVLQQWVKHGLRNTPTAIYPLDTYLRSETEREAMNITLKTTRQQEAFTYIRPTFDHTGHFGTHTTHPDLDKATSTLFYCPEPGRVFAQLPFLRPSVLYIFGGKSEVSPPVLREDRVRNTGIAVGGNGGAVNGRVRDICFDQVGHQIPQEVPRECAEAISRWLGPELNRWHEEDKAFRAEFDRMSPVEKVTSCDRWKYLLPNPYRREQTHGKSQL